MLYVELRELMKSSRGGDMLRQALLDLSEYTQSHFAREETWMREFRYPGTITHVAEHATLTEKVGALERCHAREGTTIVAVKMLRLLGTWLPVHIGETDRAFGEYLARIGATPTVG